MLNKLGFAVAATESLSLRIQFELRYDSEPPDGVVRLGTELKNGVTVRF